MRPPFSPLLLSLLLTACTPRPPAAPPAEPSPRGAVLTGVEAERVFHQCSRGTPQNVSGFWMPSAPEIAALEQRLWHPPLELAVLESYRQYSGFTQEGRRRIYINGFTEFAAHDSQWHQVGVVVCDGGPAFFGAVYDVESGKILEMNFNGPYRLRE